MISLFKNNSLYSLGAVIILLLLIRIYVITLGLPLMVPELNWMLVGERMHRGFILYKQIWDNLSPLSGMVYWLLDVSFGRSQLTYQVCSLLLVIIQALLFNQISKKNQLYHEKSNIPALLYIVCMSIFPDFYTLSPVLMGLTFLLLALDDTFVHISEYTDNDEVFAVGFYTGVATLFFLPFALFMGFALISFLLLAATGVRKYFLMIVGFAFPIGLAALFFYIIGGLEEFYVNWLTSLLHMPKEVYISIKDLLLIFSPFLLLLLAAAQQLLSGDARFINYQIRCQQTMFLWIITAGLCISFAQILAPYLFIIFVPAVAFFATHFFLLIRKAWIGEIVFLLTLVIILFINYNTFFNIMPAPSPISVEGLLVKPTTISQKIEGKKLLVVGRGSEHYINNTPATPYVNWQLAQRHFNDLDNYITVIEVFRNFQKDMPDVIVDRNGKVAELFNRIPALAKDYTTEEGSNIYIKKKKAKSGGNKS